jgi:hypothetical protein
MREAEYDNEFNNQIYEYLTAPSDVPTLGDLHCILNRYLSYLFTIKGKSEYEDLIPRLEARIKYMQKLIADIRAGKVQIPRCYYFQSDESDPTPIVPTPVEKVEEVEATVEYDTTSTPIRDAILVIESIATRKRPS